MGIFSRFFKGGQDDDPAPGVGVTFRTQAPGLTPAFATPTNTAAPAPEPGRSLWEWTGPTPRRTERGVAPPSAISSDVPAAAPEPRTQARGGLPSVPRS